MSTFRVTIERLEVKPHPNADRLELARVGLYHAVVPKGAYRTGETAVYIPEQAILPGVLIEELGLTGRLSGKDRNRVKAVRLRGEVSQGIVCRPAALDGIDWASGDLGEDSDGCIPESWAADLGITKWVPEIPPHMAGEIEAAPNLIRWVDIENLKRYPDMFAAGEPVVASEKIHGTACLLTVEAASGRAWVSSKGHGSRSTALVQSDTNLYWRAVEQHNLIELLLGWALDNPHSEYVGLFGEVYGAGVQDLAYGANARRNETLGFAAFDMAFVEAGQRQWLNADQFSHICDTIGIPRVPVLYRGPFDLAALTVAAAGPTVLGEGEHIREGIVIRPAVEQEADVTGGRKIAKLVSDAYLLRDGGTEFE